MVGVKNIVLMCSLLSTVEQSQHRMVGRVYQRRCKSGSKHNSKNYLWQRNQTTVDEV
jgi:hypothetical protein